MEHLDHLGETRPRALSKRIVGTGELKFVYLLCRGDLRQWFEKLGPRDGVLGPEAVNEFVTSFCKSMSVEVPKNEIAEFLEHVAEVKFHDFVLLALLIIKPLRSLGRLELDEELLEDAEDSTSEGEDDEEAAEAAPAPISQPPKPTRPRGSSMVQQQPPALTRIQSRLRAGSVRKEGVLQYVSFVAKKDTTDWFLQLASSLDETLPLGVVKPFFESLASALRLKDWKQPLDEALLLVSSVKYPEFVRLFLEVSRASRECSDLKIDDELMGLDEDSTSEGSDDEDEAAGSTKRPEAQAPAIRKLQQPQKKQPSHRFSSPREPVWCPPFVEGQHKSIQQLKPELVSNILSFLSVEDLLKSVLVCKAWAKAVNKFPPFQHTHLSLYHPPADLPKFQHSHKLLRNLTFMRQFDSEKIEPILKLFPDLRVLRLTSHAAPKCVGELASLEFLQCEGRLPPTLLKHLSALCHRTLTTLNLSRDFTLSDEDRMIPGLASIKEFSKLKELNLEGCKGEGLNYILQTCAMIRSLNVGFMMISNIHCQLIGGNLFHLRSLVLRSTDVTDDGLYEIGLGCKKLERVYLENCKKIGAQGVVDLIANCTQISVLKLAGCSQLKDDAIFALSGAKNLVELDCQLLELVSSRAWYILVSKLQNLRILHAWGCSFTSDVLSKVHRRCLVYHALTARNLNNLRLDSEKKSENTAEKRNSKIYRPASGVLSKPK